MAQSHKLLLKAALLRSQAASSLPPPPQAHSSDNCSHNIASSVKSRVSVMTGTNRLTNKTSSAGGRTSTRVSCLCSPTTHAGSFRCRLHRSGSLHGTGQTPVAVDQVESPSLSSQSVDTVVVASDVDFLSRRFAGPCLHSSSLSHGTTSLQSNVAHKLSRRVLSGATGLSSDNLKPATSVRNSPYFTRQQSRLSKTFVAQE